MNAALALCAQDIELIKGMNMNAVRMSHYPPHLHFLDLSDELGLFVIDELTGWQKSYDTAVGAKLVRELVERDVNHLGFRSEGSGVASLHAAAPSHGPQGLPNVVSSHGQTFEGTVYFNFGR